MAEQIKELPSVGKRLVVGAILTLLVGPGNGHVLLGANKRALAWLVAVALLLLLVPYSIWFMLIATLGTRIACMADLWSLSRRVTEVPKRGPATFNFVVFGALTIVLLVGVRIACAQGFNIPSAAMEPTLRIGDHMMIRKFMAEPERGAVVVFEYPCAPKKDFVQRIVALEGDLVEVRCDKVYVNGEAVPVESVEGQCTYWEPGYSDSGWEERECRLFAESIGGHDYHIIHEKDASEAGQAGAFDFPGASLPSCLNTAAGHGGSSQALGVLIDTKNNTNDYCAQGRAYKVPDGHFFVMGDNRANSSDSRVWGPVPNESLRGIAAYVWWAKQKGAVSWGRLGQALN